MVVTEHTYLREIRKSLNLDITVAMLVTYMQEGHPRLSIIKFDKRKMFWHWFPQNSRNDRNLQAVSGYMCYIGDRNLSCVTMSIRLAGFYCALSETLTCRLGSKLKI
jgi:hypothetical protein